MSSLEAFKTLGLKWTDYIPTIPTPKQLAFLLLPHKEAIYGGAAGGGKGLPFSAGVSTPFGMKSIGSLKVGSKVNATDGTVAEVIQVWNRGIQPCYRLTWHDGSVTTCDEDHLWLGWVSGKSRKVGGERTHARLSAKKWTTKELYRCFGPNRTFPERQRFAIPVIDKPVVYNVHGENRGRNVHISRSIDPYVLGVLLGDGWVTEQAVCFCSADQEIVDQVGQCLGMTLHPYKSSESKVCKTYPLSGLRTQLTLLGMLGKRAWEKSIPRVYKLGSVEDRWSLLQGLMDTDGWADLDGDCYYVSTSSQLCEDVKEIARSLGALVTSTEKSPSHQGGKGRKAYCIRIKIPEASRLFRLTRKKERAKLEPQSMGRFLVSIEQVAPQETICIQVSHPNSLFITDDFVVTHNSEALLMAALQYVDIPGYSAIIFRKTLTDLRMPGALIDRSMQWLKDTPAKWEGGSHSWSFPTFDHNGYPSIPAKLTFGYIGESQAYIRYQGTEYAYCAFDEVVNHEEADYRFLFSRLRKCVCPIHQVVDGKPNYVDGCPICERQKSVPIRMRCACVDEGEVLTQSGWKSIQEVQVGEKVYSVSPRGTMELKEVEWVFSGKTTDPLVRVKKQNLYMSMTRDHRVVYRVFGSSLNRIKPWDEHYGRSIEIVRSADFYSGPGLKGCIAGIPIKDYLPFLGIYLAEGSFGKPRRGNYKVIVTQCQKAKMEEVQKLLNCLPFRNCYSRNGDFQITNKALWEHVSQFGKAHEKYIPREILEQGTFEQLSELLKWLVYGDGHRRGEHITYVTCSPRLAGDVAELGAKLGYKVSQSKKALANKNHRDRYTIYLSKSNRVTTKVDTAWDGRNDTTLVPYSGMVYCIKVKDNFNFVLRQRGFVWVSGNTNPGGFPWVKQRFKIEPDIDPRKAEKTGQRVRYVGKHPKRPFIPSFLADNPHLDQESYADALDELDPVTKAMLKEGRWDVSPDSRFKRNWVRYYSRRGDYFTLGADGAGAHHHHDTLQRIFVTVDPATSSKHGPGDILSWKKQPSYTVISVWGLTQNYHLLWLDMVRFRREIPDVILALKRVQRVWKPDVFYIDGTGVGVGVYQTAANEGLTVQPIHTRVDKVVNSTEAMVRMSQGRIWFPQEASWLTTAEDEIFFWTGGNTQTDDIVDTLSNAARVVSWEDVRVMEDVAEPGLDHIDRTDDLPSVVSELFPFDFDDGMQYYNGY